MIKMLFMDLKEIEARNDCAGEGQKEFHWLSEWVPHLLCHSSARNYWAVGQKQFN
jgi:hypothetical protein